MYELKEYIEKIRENVDKSIYMEIIVRVIEKNGKIYVRDNFDGVEDRKIIEGLPKVAIRFSKSK